MDGFRISNRADRDFGIVPRALWSMQLSAHAKLLAAYLCCLRDGQPVPAVGAIEAAVGIGRDARRRAFAELIAAQIIAWRIERRGGQIVAKTLDVDQGAIRAPESQADGRAQPQIHRAPEKPSVGISGGHRLDFRRSPPESQAIPKREERKEKGEIDLGKAGSPESFDRLTSLQRSLLRNGETLRIGGTTWQRGSEAMATLSERFRAWERAEHGA